MQKIHDLIRLHKLLENDILLNSEQYNNLMKLNELYIDSRYPGDMGLLPDGKPSLIDVKEFLELAEYIYKSVNFYLK